MKKAQVKVGGVYAAKVSGKVVQVRLDSESRYGGWEATNLATKKRVRVKSAQRLRYAVPAKGDASAKAAAKDATRANVGGDTAATGDAKAAKKAKVEAWRKGVAAKVAQPDPALDQAVAAADKDRKAKREKKAKAAGAKAERKPGLLTLAAEVLARAKEPMDAKALVEKVLAGGRWATKGKTPAATLYAAIIREIAAKGKAARFRKTGRGRFAAAGKDA